MTFRIATTFARLRQPTMIKPGRLLTTSILAILALCSLSSRPAIPTGLTLNRTSERSMSPKLKILATVIFSGASADSEKLAGAVGANTAAGAEEYQAAIFAALVYDETARRAVLLSRQAVERYPDNTDLLASAAIALYLDGKVNESKGLLSLAKANRQDSGLLRAAQALHLDGEEHPYAPFAQAFALAPQSPFIWFTLTRLQLLRGDKGAAVKEYERWFMAHPDHALVALWKGDLETVKELAVNAYTQAIKSNPRLATAYRQRGKLHLQARKYSQALADFDHYEKLSTGDFKLWGNRAECHANLGQTDMAIKDLDRALVPIEQSESHFDANNNKKQAAKYHAYLVRYKVARAELYQKKGLYARAIADARQILATEPLEAGALNIVQEASMRQKDYPAAIDALTRLISIDVDVSEWYQYRSAAYRKYGKPKEAQADAITAEKIDRTGLP